METVQYVKADPQPNVMTVSQIVKQNNQIGAEKTKLIPLIFQLNGLENSSALACNLRLQVAVYGLRLRVMRMARPVVR